MAMASSIPQAPKLLPLTLTLPLGVAVAVAVGVACRLPMQRLHLHLPQQLLPVPAAAVLLPRRAHSW